MHPHRRHSSGKFPQEKGGGGAAGVQVRVSRMREELQEEQPLEGARQVKIFLILYDQGWFRYFYNFCKLCYIFNSALSNKFKFLQLF